ncbi:hypothetical protein ORI20_30700 [Mycobacterium sp. CVI_P3]|uniref:Secreted protein n=1 Tax=Mycobacterium pinniadriaticum TaxID=2994102 RepID=A0ABT3SQ95_9MYCO|nr:hypothetical protein [Mycobacterium pinniadriaticum]MCX2934642.1 hypothetical protein [Mycobacterium pinniadriaticum]MCX2941065.1 hypothetical protein [Mycobacterium pinniadriaticum]
MRKVTARVGAALVMAAAGVAATHATSSADPAAPGQQVTYTLATAGPAEFTVTYLTAQPPSKEAFNADSDAFMKRENITVSPDAPWVFQTTLEDPQWAFLQVASTTHGGQAAPNAHCEVAIDGQVAIAQDAPYNPQCYLSKWS